MRPLHMCVLAAVLAGAVLSGCAFEGGTLPVEPTPGVRCARDLVSDRLSCRHRTLTIATGAFGLSAREVHFEVPDGEAPPTGWPVSILFQGSLHSAEGMWARAPGDAFGGEHETELVQALLLDGFAVVTPEARYDGATYWDTNVLPYSLEWEIAEDHQLMQELFVRIEDGTMGPLDANRMVAAGISSGGYMTSRMALSYPGRCRALAIQSASFATCAGPVCTLPDALPEDHPPTLFLHGDADLVVPVSTMRDYADGLAAAGVASEVIVAAGEGHAWLAAAPVAITNFFRSALELPEND